MVKSAAAAANIIRIDMTSTVDNTLINSVPLSAADDNFLQCIRIAYGMDVQFNILTINSG